MNSVAAEIGLDVSAAAAIALQLRLHLIIVECAPELCDAVSSHAGRGGRRAQRRALHRGKLGRRTSHWRCGLLHWRGRAHGGHGRRVGPSATSEIVPPAETSWRARPTGRATTSHNPPKARSYALIKILSTFCERGHPV